MNRFGLQREIPAAVKLAVRQRCRFGCVICGKGVFHYEHFDPEYKDATRHDADGITLLCGACHDEATRGLLTKEQISKFNSDPYCVRNGNAFGVFRTGGKLPIIKIGNSQFVGCRTAVEIAGEKVLWFTHPDDPAEGFNINARVRDTQGNIILEITKNAWIVGDRLWDVSTTGNRLEIRSEPRAFLLSLNFLPPKTIQINRAEIKHKGASLVITSNGDIQVNGFTYQCVDAYHWHTGLRVTSSGDVMIGCNRPQSLDYLFCLWLTSSMVSPVICAKNRPLMNISVPPGKSFGTIEFLKFQLTA